jgi:hypothetical protein
VPGVGEGCRRLSALASSLNAGLRVAAFLLLQPGAAAASDCRLALALGFDVSRSIDAAAYELQLGGLLAALFDPEVRAALLAPPAPVALAVYEWSGRRQQRLVQGWTRIETEDDIDRVARAVALNRRRHDGLTAVGAALDYGWRLMRRAPVCDAQVIDIAGDGRNNEGADPHRIYARRDFGRITVNGLAIGGHESGILSYYATEVIRGPGAFAEFAASQQDFAAALRRKLLREIDPPLLGQAPARPRDPGLQAASSPASARSISAAVSATP